jgi:ketosteroid isomerase-like protein
MRVARVGCAILSEAMSEDPAIPELAELVRRQLEAVNRRDLDALMTAFAPDAVYDTSPSGMGVYEGHTAIGVFLKGYWDCFDELRFELEEAVDLGNGVSFLVNRQLARPVGSSAQVETREAHVIEWTDDMVVRLTVYNDIEKGRAAAQRLAKSRDSPGSDQSIRELVRKGYEWFNREKEPPPTWLPDGEFVNSREDPDHETYRGIDAIRKQHQGWFDAYPDLRVEPLEIRSNGDRVFAWVRFTGHGADSGIAMEMELAHVVTIENGRTRRIEEYSDRAEALEAVGLA